MNPIPFNRRPFNPAWRVPQDPVVDTTNKHPNVVVAIGLVPYGYQVDYYVNGQHVETECSDFADDYKISKLEVRFANVIQQAIQKERKKL